MYVRVMERQSSDIFRRHSVYLRQVMKSAKSVLRPEESLRWERFVKEVSFDVWAGSEKEEVKQWGYADIQVGWLWGLCKWVRGVCIRCVLLLLWKSNGAWRQIQEGWKNCDLRSMTGYVSVWCRVRRSVGVRQFADSGHHISGALLCHLPAAAVSTLADRLPLVPDARHGLAVCVHCHDPNRRPPTTPTARQRRSQVHRGTNHSLDNCDSCPTPAKS